MFRDWSIIWRSHLMFDICSETWLELSLTTVSKAMITPWLCDDDPMMLITCLWIRNPILLQKARWSSHKMFPFRITKFRKYCQNDFSGLCPLKQNRMINIEPKYIREWIFLLSYGWNTFSHSGGILLEISCRYSTWLGEWANY